MPEYFMPMLCNKEQMNFRCICSTGYTIRDVCLQIQKTVVLTVFPLSKENIRQRLACM